MSEEQETTATTVADMSPELLNKYVGLGRVFEEIISFSDAAMYIRTHFDIKLNSETNTVTVVKVPDDEALRRVTLTIEAEAADQVGIVDPTGNQVA